MASLPASTGGDAALTRQIYNQAMDQRARFLNSVESLIGGVYDNPGDDVRYQFIATEKQRAAVRFIPGEGSESLEIYARNDLLCNMEPAGGLRQIGANRETLVRGLVTGQNWLCLRCRHGLSPTATVFRNAVMTS